MITPRALTCLCLLALAAAPALGSQAECRKPTPAETAAAAKLSKGVKEAVEGPLTALGWKLQRRKSDEIPLSIGVDANPPRPLGSCWPLYAATFAMSEASPRYAQLKAAYDKGLEAGTAWMGGCLKTLKGCDPKDQPAAMTAGEHASAAMNLEIRGGENTPYMRSPRSEPVNKIDVAGAAVAYWTEDQDPLVRKYTLCFGPWKPETVFSPSTSSVLFPFKHGKLTPYVENICVNIRAAREIAEEIIGKIDWKPLNAALTP